MRDVEDLMLQTLRLQMARDTGIPSGHIWLKRPEIDFLQKVDGPNVPAFNTTNLPAIGIEYFKDAQILPNNYGPTRYVKADATTTTSYSPIGELRLNLAIRIYAASKKELRQYSTLLYMSLLKNSFITYETDTIQGEYFSVLLKTMRDLDDLLPVQRIFIVQCLGRILEETTGYTVNEIDISLGTTQSNAVVNDVLVNVNYNSENPLVMDDFSEGSNERSNVI